MLNGLVALLWALPTIRWRLELGPFSLALLEPFTLFVIALLLIRRYMKRGKITLPAGVVTGLLVLLLAWVAFSRLLGEDLKHDLSDIRDWGIPILTYLVILSTVRKGWRRLALVFVLVGVLQSGLGIFQHFTNSFRPFASAISVFKLDYGGLSTVSYAAGLFDHPNNLATYLTIAFLIALGWLEETQSWKAKAAALLSLLIMAAGLYWTYAKAQLATLALLIFFFWFLRHFRSIKLYVTVAGLALLATFFTAWAAIVRFPYEFRTIWWRVSLWKSVFQTVSIRPLTLLIGDGDVSFAHLAIYPQPHNVYFDLLLDYGLPGLALVLVLVYLLGLYGLRSYHSGLFRRSAILRALWLSLLSSFLNGFVESSFIGIETRMQFFIILACFFGLRREIANGLSAKIQKPVLPPQVIKATSHPATENPLAASEVAQ